MPTKLFKNITLPKTYEESREFYENFNFKRRLGRVHYHTPVELILQGRFYQELDPQDWTFKPIVLLCNCTFEYKDCIDPMTWDVDSTITCSNCGRVFTEKQLKLCDRIIELKNVREKRIFLSEQSMTGGENDLSSADYNRIYKESQAHLFEEADPIFKPAYKFGELARDNHKNTVSAVADVKETDEILSLTGISVTLDLIQTSLTNPKWIHKLSIHRSTLAYNKLDGKFRRSYYLSGRYGQRAYGNGEQLTSAVSDSIPVITARVRSGVVGLSFTTTLTSIQNFSTRLASCGRLTYGYVRSNFQLKGSGITRMTEGLEVLEDFANRLNQLPSMRDLPEFESTMTLADLLENPIGDNLIEFYDNIRRTLVRTMCRNASQNITLINDAIDSDIIKLMLRIHEEFHCSVNETLIKMLNGTQYTSVRTLLRRELGLSKRGVKAYLQLMKEAVNLPKEKHFPAALSSIGNVNQIKDTAISYEFLKNALESLELERDNTDIFQIYYWVLAPIMHEKQSFINAGFGAKFKRAAQDFYDQLIHRTIMINTNHAGNVTSDIMRSLDSVVERLQSMDRTTRQPMVDYVLNFMIEQRVLGLDACEQAFLNLQNELIDTFPIYKELVKTDHIELKQSDDDYETFETTEGETSFTIPKHGLDMYRLGRELNICVGGRYYQESVARKRIQIVVAEHEGKKVVFEISRPSEYEQSEGHGIVVQAKSRFNETAESYPEMLEDLKAYIAHLKLGVRTYDLPASMQTAN